MYILEGCFFHNILEACFFHIISPWGWTAGMLPFFPLPFPPSLASPWLLSPTTCRLPEMRIPCNRAAECSENWGIAPSQESYIRHPHAAHPPNPSSFFGTPDLLLCTLGSTKKLGVHSTGHYILMGKKIRPYGTTAKKFLFSSLNEATSCTDTPTNDFPKRGLSSRTLSQLTSPPHMYATMRCTRHLYMCTELKSSTGALRQCSWSCVSVRTVTQI